MTDKQLLQALTSGNEPVQNFPGFPLSPVNFRPQSFYAESPELSACYRARQWYANVDYRLSDERETRLALYLSWLVQRDPELLKLWQQLTRPYDRMLALPEDATVTDYYQAMTNLCGANIGAAEIKSRGVDIVKKLRANPRLPRINDQQLSPAGIRAVFTSDSRFPAPAGTPTTVRCLFSKHRGPENSRAFFSVGT